jgi:hypothetical protein
MTRAILKASYQGDIRRTRFEADEITYDDVCQAISKLFPDLQEYTAKYVDEEGDACTLCETTFTDFLSVSEGTRGHLVVNGTCRDKLLLKLELSDAPRVAAPAPAAKSFEQDLQNRIEQQLRSGFGVAGDESL